MSKDPKYVARSVDGKKLTLKYSQLLNKNTNLLIEKLIESGFTVDPSVTKYQWDFSRENEVHFNKILENGLPLQFLVFMRE